MATGSKGLQVGKKLALNDLARVRSASDADDKSLGPSRCRGKVVGDPEIVDCKNRYFDYVIQPC